MDIDLLNLPYYFELKRKKFGVAIKDNFVLDELFNQKFLDLIIEKYLKTEYDKKCCKIYWNCFKYKIPYDFNCLKRYISPLKSLETEFRMKICQKVIDLKIFSNCKLCIENSCIEVSRVCPECESTHFYEDSSFGGGHHSSWEFKCYHCNFYDESSSD